MKYSLKYLQYILCLLSILIEYNNESHMCDITIPPYSKRITFIFYIQISLNKCKSS